MCQNKQSYNGIIQKFISTIDAVLSQLQSIQKPKYSLEDML